MSSRDSWCTPRWLAGLIGRVDLDPCSNDRSHVDAMLSLHEEDDGLECSADEDITVFCNPPYSRGQVIKWVRQFRHTRFIFLLRWDTSTEWFSALIPYCTHVWFPDRRIDFEPPPGVKASSNPFPHALYMRDPSPFLLGRLQACGWVFRVDEANYEDERTPDHAAN